MIEKLARAAAAHPTAVEFTVSALGGWFALNVYRFALSYAGLRELVGAEQLARSEQLGG